MTRDIIRTCFFRKMIENGGEAVLKLSNKLHINIKVIINNDNHTMLIIGLEHILQYFNYNNSTCYTTMALDYYDFCENVKSGVIIYDRIMNSFIPRDIYQMPNYDTEKRAIYNLTEKEPVRECPVCLDEFGGGKPCCINGHYVCFFCRPLIYTSCPLCRSPLTYSL